MKTMKSNKHFQLVPVPVLYLFTVATFLLSFSLALSVCVCLETLRRAVPVRKLNQTIKRGSSNKKPAQRHNIAYRIHHRVKWEAHGFTLSPNVQLAYANPYEAPFYNGKVYRRFLHPTHDPYDILMGGNGKVRQTGTGEAFAKAKEYAA